MCLKSIRSFVLLLLLAIMTTGCQPPGDSPEASPNRGAGEGSAAQTESDDEGSGDETPLTFERMSPLVAEYEEVATVLNLTDGERLAIEQVKEKHKSIFSDWYANQGQQLKQIQRNAMKAARGRDLRSLRKMNSSGDKARSAELQKQERAMQAAFESELLAALPAEKVVPWKAYRISKTLFEFLSPLELTEPQRTALQEHAPQVIRSLGRQKNWQGVGTKKLEEFFESRVIDESQRSRFDELKNSNKLRMLRWMNAGANG